MLSVGRILALLLIFAVASVAWFTLGGVTSMRAHDVSLRLEGEVGDLWGRPLQVDVPVATASWTTQAPVVTRETDAAGRTVERSKLETTKHERAATFTSTRAVVGVRDDVRRKGLVWYPLYEAEIAATWTLESPAEAAGTLEVVWPFPDPGGDYDGLVFRVDGVDRAGALDAQGSRLAVSVPTVPGQHHVIELQVGMRGRDELVLRPVSGGVGDLVDFDVTVTTDFTDLDHPDGTLSPSTTEPVDGGRALRWRFDHMVTGKGLGVVVPCPVQPGELASAMAFSAPISLGLFMVWLVVLGVLRGVDVHPVNHLLLAASFFAFHLMFAYLADWVPVEVAFGVSAVVSVALVVTYLIRVVSPRFAVVEAGSAQLVYLVGFALAHFQEGLTGLTLTVIGVVTLAALMQLTAHVRWTEVFGGAAASPAAR